MSDGSVGMVFISAIVVLVIFLICREIVCWYWKINRGIELLEEIRNELQVMNGKTPAEKPPRPY